MRGWTAATALGFCLAFLSFLPGQQAATVLAPDDIANATRLADIPDHIDPNDLPEGLDRGTYESLYRLNLLGHVIALGVFGLVLGSFQAYALRRRLQRRWPWIVASAVGFVAILGLEAVRRHVVIGPHAGPVEPIAIALGGGSLAGFLQWLHLRRHGTDPTRWLGRWIAGLAVGIVASLGLLVAFEITLLPSVKALFPSEETAMLIDWALFLVVYGAGVGLAAGWISGPPPTSPS